MKSLSDLIWRPLLWGDLPERDNVELKNYFIQDSYGNKLPYADGSLYLEGTTTLASGLVDANGDPLSNPVSSGSGGLIQFAAPNGRYDLLVQKGTVSYSIKVQCNDVTDTITAVEDVRDETGSYAIDALNYVGQTQILTIQAQQAALDAEDSATAAVAGAWVTNLAALRDVPIPSLASGRTVGVYVASYAAVGDGGEGNWYWQGNSNEAASDMVIVPNSNPTVGRWKRAYYGSLRPEFFGAKGDYDFDTKQGTVDTDALQRMFNWASKDGTEIRPMAGKKYLTGTLHLYYDATLNPNWSGNAGRTKIVGQANGHATGALEDPGCAFVHTDGTAGPLLEVKGFFTIELPTGMGGYFSMEDFNLVGGNATTDVLSLRGSQGSIFLKNYTIKMMNPSGNGITEATTWEANHMNGLIRGGATGLGTWTGTCLNITSDGSGGQINMKIYNNVDCYRGGYGIRIGRQGQTTGTFGPLVFIGGQTSLSDYHGMWLDGGITGFTSIGQQHEQSRLNGLRIDSAGANDLPRQIKFMGTYFTECGTIQDGSYNEFSVHCVDGVGVELDSLVFQNTRSGIAFDQSKSFDLLIRRPLFRTLKQPYAGTNGRGIEAYGTFTPSARIRLEQPSFYSNFLSNIVDPDNIFAIAETGFRISTAVLSATPSLTLGGTTNGEPAHNLNFNHASPQVVTDIPGGKPFQRLHLTFSNNNTTIQSNGNIYLQDGRDFTPKNSKASLVLLRVLTYWVEVSRSYGAEPKPIVIQTSAVALPHPGTITTEYTFVSVNIPPAILGLNGILEVEAVFSYSNNANTKTMRFRHGGGAFFSTTATATSSASFLKKIQNRGVANSQLGEAASNQAQGGTNANAPYTATVDTSTTTAVDITGQLAVGTDAMTLERYIVRVIV